MKTKPLVTVKSICRRPNKAMGSHCSSGQQLNRLGPTSDMRTKLNVSSFELLKARWRLCLDAKAASQSSKLCKYFEHAEK